MPNEVQRDRVSNPLVAPIVAIIAVVCFLAALATYNGSRRDEAFEAPIDWSAPTHPSGLMPKSLDRDTVPENMKDAVVHIDGMLKALDNPVSHGTAIVFGSASSLQQPTIVARFSSNSATSHDYAEAATLNGHFFQTCRLMPGGSVELLAADEFTYLVVYTPPLDAHLTLDDCHGHEVFFVEKQRK